MDSILVKPRNKEELDLVSSVLTRMNIKNSIQKTRQMKKKRAKEAFLDSLPERLNEVKLHMEGKLELKSWDEVKNSL